MRKFATKDIIAIVLFGVIIIIPFSSTDFLGGKVSETEKRQLAPFPVSYSEGKVDVSRSAVENWIGDNIGFREAFVKTYTVVKNKLFGLSTSPLVLPGKGGWYFYTADHNIEIALGTYPLDESDLALIAKYQQAISDYYHSVGKEYILMLTPSKASVYSEYLPMADETVENTPVDMVADYLREHTDVIVYNSKNDLLKAKSEGQLFHKTDTHWNDRGSYCVYKGLFKTMKEHGILSGEPIDVTFEDGEYKGEFSAMLGNINLLPPEKAPFAQWNQTFETVTDGEQFASVTAMQIARNPSLGCSVLKNDNINDGKILQIYGDSQIDVFRKIPCYLAEHFSEVFNYAIRNVSTTVDEIANPDIVVFSCSERYIKNLLTVPADIPAVSVNLSDIPNSEKVQYYGNHGMWLDYCNNQLVNEQGFIDPSLYAGSDSITLVGWAADFSTMQPLSALYLQIGDMVLQCRYGIERNSVSSYFGVDSLLYTGFDITFPTEYLGNQSVSDIQFIQISSDGTYQYAPVSYSIRPQG